MPRTTNIIGKPPIGVLIGMRLKELQKEQKWISESSGISQTYICAIINGRAIPSFHVLRTLSKCLDIDVKELTNALLSGD